MRPEHHAGEKLAFSLLRWWCLLAERVHAGGYRSGPLVSPGVTGRRLDKVPATRAVAGCVSCGPVWQVGAPLCQPHPGSWAYHPAASSGAGPVLFLEALLCGASAQAVPAALPRDRVLPAEDAVPTLWRVRPRARPSLENRGARPRLQGEGPWAVTPRPLSAMGSVTRGLREGSATGQSGQAPPEGPGLVCRGGPQAAPRRRPQCPHSPLARLQGCLQGTCSLPRAAQTTEQSPSRGASPGCPEFPPEGGARRLWRWDPGSPRILSSYPQPWAMSSGATCFLARLDIVGFGLSGSAFCQNSLSTSVEEPVGRWTARMLCSDQALGQDAQASLRPFRERDSMGHRGAAAGRVPSVDGPALLLPGAVREEALGQGLPGGGML